MLAPDARQVATDILRPPPGYRLDRAVITTYSLDLEVLLALPLAVLAQSDEGVDTLLEQPLLLLQALREATDRVHVFVDETGISVPRLPRELYSALESSVHPVRAPGGGAFHPKVWVARFASDDEQPVIRVAVASRNLTFDRSWDIALVSEGRAGEAESVPGSATLADLVRRLPAFATERLQPEFSAELQHLSDELGRTRFPAPEGFDSELTFHALGLGNGSPDRAWQPMDTARRVLAIAPFVGSDGLQALTASGAKERILISRAETLDVLPASVHRQWRDQQVMLEAELEEAEDETAGRPAGLHAKAVIMEHGYRAYWFVGSANLTWSALAGRNVEVMAEVSGSKGYSEGKGVGIDRFLEAGFAQLCAPYAAKETEPADAASVAAEKALQQLRNDLLHSDMRIFCAPGEEDWRWELVGSVPELEAVELAYWPVTLNREQARSLENGPSWQLPLERLTVFVAFRLRATAADVDDLTFVLKLPTEGMPDGRSDRVLRMVINTPERFLQFLRALLGGLEGLVEWAGGEGYADGQSQHWGSGFEADTLLEDLLRAASRDPERLEAVRGVIEDLTEASGDAQVVPEDLRAIWQAVDQALKGRAQR